MQLIIDFLDTEDLKYKLEQMLVQYGGTTITQTQEITQVLPDNFSDPIHIRKQRGRTRKRWSQYEIDLVKDWYLNKPRFTAEDMARSLGRTKAAVTVLISKLLKEGMTPRYNRAGKLIETTSSTV